MFYAEVREVSIHAPVMGATLSFAGTLFWFVPVSIHAPVMGATSSSVMFSARAASFQSTRP